MRKQSVFSERSCIVCSKTIPSTGPRQKYCSTICTITDNITVDENNCWNWNGYTINGYGQITHKRKKFLTHKVMCESVHGPVEDSSVKALHSCDNRACCNPDHLRWGSQGENMEDMKNRGRSLYGQKNPHSTLTDDIVKDIIEQLKNYQYGDYTKIGKKYNIGKSTIRSIHKNNSWKHLPR